MTENEAKAIKWMKNVRDDAVAALDHIEKNEPNVSPILYAGRKEKAETIIKGFEELEQYRSIGTVEEYGEKLNKLAEYVCENLCKIPVNSAYTQEVVDAFCEKCKLNRLVEDFNKSHKEFYKQTNRKFH